ncbi:filamentous hemagglutinin N-terminal domain-containing protein, partial [Nodularia sp. LEGE 04288]|nr:filamentous hemagglutinin N-terminal domain-containing protein [Nodularia sp. LEGE 04288]
MQFIHILPGFLVSSLMCFSLAPLHSAKAQIIPDGTLGAESSVVTYDQIIEEIPSDKIDGGAIRGRNLFHSFQEFNIESGRGAYFTNPSGIENILTRVTGSNVSNILGTLGVFGNANLFLMNPNGIIFGQNARLDVGGSFLATTANSVLFENGLKFRTINPEVPPLLTITAPIGLGLAKNPANIVNNAINLQVNPGNTLALVGGNITLDGATVQTSGGRLELGGLTGEGIVNLHIQTSEGLQKLTSLSFPDSVERADVSLSNHSVVKVIGENNGSIAINARNVNIMGGSTLTAGIAARQGKPESQAGHIKINATDKVVVDGISSPEKPSGVFNLVDKGAVGNSGNIEIHAKTVEVTNGGQLNASTLGTGNAGKIQITATDKVVFDGQSVYGCGNACISSALSQVESEAEGQAGIIEIIAQSLIVKNKAQLSASSLGTGNAGNINIKVKDTININEGILSAVVTETAKGNGGNIEINSGSLNVFNSGQLNASTLGEGDAGNVKISASDTVSVYNHGIVSALVREKAEGNGGDIEINTDSLNVFNSGQL